MRKILLIFFLITTGYSSWGQRGCATDEANQLNKSKEEILLEQQAFEEWLLEKKARPVSQNALQELAETKVYQIPVVVHIIHNGEPLGEGLNIAYEQVISQIEVLNRDFRHLNADSINTPDIFKPFMADIGFEFVLAKQDSNGLPTNGITRTNGARTNWNPLTDNIALKSLEQWPSDNYLNIWVAPLTYPWLGQAEFPSSDIIEGTEQASNNPLTDGVVIHTLAFGSSEFYPLGSYENSFDLGRTATHEIGHFFGLHHMWGSSFSCSVDDYVHDTPKTNYKYEGCHEEETSTYSCNDEPSMFMNYMDYVSDGCMNLFTHGQKERMIIVINNSPRRASLLTSPALKQPTVLDATITAIPSPGGGTCVNTLYPTITLRNSGTITLTEIELAISASNIEATRQIFSLSLSPQKDTTLLLPEFSLSQFGNITFTAQILSTNGQKDYYPDNNSLIKEVFFSEIVTAIDENFDNWPESWAIRSADPVSKWNFMQAPHENLENKAAVLSYYKQYPGANDLLVLPLLDLASYTSPYLIFDYAYGQTGEHNDALAVMLSYDCGQTFQDTLLLQSGKELATTQIPASFTPSGPIDWHTSVLNLSDFVSQPVQLAFLGKSDGGNNIYLDNIKVVERGYEDIRIKGLLNESGVYNTTISSIGLIIENTGTTTLNSLEVEVYEDKKIMSSKLLPNLNLEPEERRVIYLENNFNNGSYNLQFKLLLNDDILENNNLTSAVTLLDKKEQIPYRIDFDNPNDLGDQNWLTNSPTDDNYWQIWHQSNNFIYYPAKTVGNIGLHDWLVLPLLDFSNASLASIQYKIAYTNNASNNEALRIWLSTNGGESFEYLLKSFSGDQLQAQAQPIDWYPQSAEDWTNQFIDLSEFAGEDNILLAFESIDGDGGNIYLDDIELFVSDKPRTITINSNQMAVYPNPINKAGAQISFNLNQKQNLEARIIDSSGNIISQEKFTNVLNQTYKLDLDNHANGLYLIQVIGPSFSGVSRVIINK